MKKYLSDGSALRRSSWLGYAFGLAAFGLALALRFALDSNLPPGFPYLTFFPAVILTTFLAGTGPGIVCALLSGLAAWYWFIPPFGSFGMTQNTAIALAFYVFIVGVDVAVIDAMVRAADRLETERAKSAKLAEQHRTLFEELQHRVANNMAFVASLLMLQKRTVAADPACASAVFDDAAHRLQVMARLHRKLHDPVSLEQPIGDYLRGLCADLVEASGAKGIVCLIDADEMRLDLTRLTALSLIVNEVMTNSLKHAFKGREGGTITLDLKRITSDRVALMVADDGPGLPAAAPSATGLGLKIVQGLAAQLGGEVSTPPTKGMATRIEFAA